MPGPAALPGRAGALELVTPYGPMHPLVPPLRRLVAQGSYTDALRAVDECAQLLRACGDERTLGVLLVLRTNVLQEMGRVHEALVLDEELLARFAASGWTVGEVKALADSAQRMLLLGREDQGLRRLGRAVWLLERCAPRGDRYLSAVLSVVACAQAAELYETATEILLGLREHLSRDLRDLVADDPLQRYFVEDYLAELLMEWGLRLEHLGRSGEARARWARSLGLLQPWVGRDGVEPYTEAMQAMVLASLGRPREALEVAGPLLPQARAAGLHREACLLHLATAVARRALGDADQAHRELVAAQELGRWYGASPAERLILIQEAARLVLDAGPQDHEAALVRGALQAHAERAWRMRLQRVVTLREARRREEEDAERLLVDQALLQDPLTALGNRRRFDEVVTALGEAGSSPGPVALVLVDIDDFKAVNDAHSHLVGDAVIRGIAEVLRANTRPVDVAMRLGGDEFALFLPALHAQAVEVAERIRGQVAERDWTAVAPGLRVTVSTGVADHVPGQDGIALFAAADEKLYDAKRGGRNRVAH